MNDPHLAEAEALDRYWIALRDDPATTPPADLPADVAALTSQLETTMRPPEPDPAFAARLGNRLASRSTITPAAARPRTRTARWLPLAGVGIAAALAVALIFVFMPQSQPVSAAEIVRKAQASASDFAAGGVRSFERIEKSEWNDAFGSRSLVEHGWFEQPNLWRYEVADPLAPLTVVADGTTLWIYEPARDTVRKQPGPQGVSPSLAFGGATSLGDALSSASNCYSPTLTGEEQIAGRAAYVIALGSSLCPSASMPETNGALTLWLDKETFFVLKSTLMNMAGTEIAQSSEVQSITYNADLPASLFTFTPPAGANVIDEGGTPTPAPFEPTATTAPTTVPTATAIAPTPTTEAAKPANNLLRPTFFPEPLTERVEEVKNAGPDGSQNYTMLHYDAQSGENREDALLLIEQASATAPDPKILEPTGKVEQIGGYNVTVGRRDGACVNMTWTQGDIALTLFNSYNPPGQLRYSCEQMERVLESVR